MGSIDFLKQNARWLSAGAMLTFLSSFGQTFFIAIFAGEIRQTFGLSHGAWGTIYALGTAASAVAMLWAGGLTDRFRSRDLGTAVLVLLSVACLLMALNRYVVLLPAVVFALRFCGQGMVSHIAVVSMSRWFVATRGKALSVAGLGFALGEAILPVSFVSLMLILDWRWLWVGSALVSLAAIPVLRTLLKQERTPQSHAAENHASGMFGRHWKRSDVLRQPLFWFMAPALLGPSAFNTAFFFHQVHFAELKGWAHFDLVALFPIYTGTAVGVMVVSGWLLDRLGSARLIIWYQVPMVVGFALFGIGQSLSSTLVGMLCLAATTGANATLPNAFWADFYGTRNIGSIKAMAAAIMVLGSAIGPGITGVLIDAGIDLERQFIGVAGFFIFATVCMAIGVGRSARDLELR